ncbi:MAG TPA: cupredoxin domain-containing protein [Nitrososphaeraceae archaeon]|nr:cupredoxin domain-containing protein [Nitrososphaeraceae archaeon]
MLKSNKFASISLGAFLLSNTIFVLNVNNSAFAQEQKTFYLFPVEIEGAEKFKLTTDSFSVKTMVAKKGDNVTIHYYNPEEQEPHNFVLMNPYNITKDLPGGQHAKISFNADKEGIYQYECTYHMPTMTGQFVVLP